MSSDWEGRVASTLQYKVLDTNATDTYTFHHGETSAAGRGPRGANGAQRQGDRESQLHPSYDGGFRDVYGGVGTGHHGHGCAGSRRRGACKSSSLRRGGPAHLGGHCGPVVRGRRLRARAQSEAQAGIHPVRSRPQVPPQLHAGSDRRRSSDRGPGRRRSHGASPRHVAPSVRHGSGDWRRLLRTCRARHGTRVHGHGHTRSRYPNLGPDSDGRRLRRSSPRVRPRCSTKCR